MKSFSSDSSITEYFILGFRLDIVEAVGMATWVDVSWRNMIFICNCSYQE